MYYLVYQLPVIFLQKSLEFFIVHVFFFVKNFILCGLFTKFLLVPLKLDDDILFLSLNMVNINTQNNMPIVHYLIVFTTTIVL